MTDDLESLSLPELVKTALERVREAETALLSLSERIDPPARRDTGKTQRRKRTSGGEVGPEMEAEILRYVPEWLRAPYAEFRQRLLRENEELTPRPAPLRNGRRRYEGFHFRGRNVIYANFRKSFIRIQFQLPWDHDRTGPDIVVAGGRPWHRIELHDDSQLEDALIEASDTLRQIAADPDGVRQQ